MPVEVQAADALRSAIITGMIPAGARITEVQLAEQMNLSRASVRTALHQIAKEGLATLVPYTGWAVMTLSAHDAWELYTLRSSVERLAAQLAARKLDGAGAASLKKAYDALVRACDGGDADKIAEADFALHKAIIALTRHGRLAQQYELIEHQIRVYIRSSDALVSNPAEIVAQHQPIVDAILAGDESEAGRLAEQHNLSEGEKLSTHLGNLQRSLGNPGASEALAESTRPREQKNKQPL
jgi:DNA-binding GntR family transcriptional regulator